MNDDPKIKKINLSLHGARGLAAFMVFLSHIGIAGITEKYFVNIPTELLIFKNILLSGQYGVEIFFMISGYIVTDSIIRHASVSSFLWDRCVRLYPVFLPVVLLIFILGPFAGYAYFSGVSWGEWVALLVINVLFVPGVYPIEAALVVAWSLSYEAVFYISLSYFKFFKSSRVAISLFVIFGVIPFLAVYPRALFFVVGVGIYFYLKNDVRKVFRLPKVFFVSLLAFLSVLFFIQFHESLDISISKTELVLLWVFSVVLGYLIFIEIALQSPAATMLLKWKWMQFFGTISYSFYVWHTPIMFGTKRIFANRVDLFGSYGAFFLFFIFSLVLAIFVSYISYVLFEVKTVEYIKRRKKSKIESFNAQGAA
ncbi:MAG: acyltransferase [Cycloclasticus sp.]|nr:acyltransferase [Cycloclasticus sp.]